MSLRRCKTTGNWKIRILVGGRNGRRINKTLDASLSRVDAMRIHDQEKARQSSRKTVKLPTFGDLAAYYMDTHAKKLALSWRRTVQYMLKNQITAAFNAKRADDLVPADVDSLLDGLDAEDYSAATVNRVRSVILGVLSHAEKNRKIDRSPIPTRSVPRREEKTKRDVYFTREEWQAFRSAFSDSARWDQYVAKIRWLGPVKGNPETGVERRYGGGLKPGSEAAEAHRRSLACAMPVFEFILLTGSRVGEILGLRWKDVDLKAGIVSIRQPKVRKQKRLGLTPEMRAALQAAGDGKGEDLVFCPTDGPRATCWHYKRIARAFDVARRLAGLRKGLTLHALRRSAATWLFQAGQPIQMAQALLGHASITTTEKHYASLAPTNVQDAVALVSQMASAAPSATGS